MPVHDRLRRQAGSTPSTHPQLAAHDPATEHFHGERRPKHRLGETPGIQTLVASGRLGYSTAYEIAKIPDAAKRDEISAEALLRPMTRKQVRDRAAGRVMTVSRQSAALKRERVVLPLGDGRSVTLAAPVIDFPGMTAALQTLLETVRRAATEGRSLPELAKALRTATKRGRAA